MIESSSYACDQSFFLASVCVLDRRASQSSTTRTYDFISLVPDNHRSADFAQVRGARLPTEQVPTELWVLAGGLGSRLRTAVPDLPKPLAPVGHRPFLSYLIENWREQGITSFNFLLQHQAHLIQAFLKSEEQSGLLSGCQVRTVIEPRRLDTGGAIAHAVRQNNSVGSFLVVNADTWLGSGIKALSQTAAPAIAIVRVGNSDRYGTVKVADDRVVEFIEKQNSSGPGSINAGLYHLNVELFNDWDGQPFSLERDLFPRLLSEGSLSAVRVDSEFLDIGVPDDYFRFCNWVAADKNLAL